MTVDLAEDLDVLALQVYSLTGVPPEDQELYLEDAQASPPLPHGSTRALSTFCLTSAVATQTNNQAAALLHFALTRISDNAFSRIADQRTTPEDHSSASSIASLSTTTTTTQTAPPSWVKEAALEALQSSCTRVYMGSTTTIQQPAFASSASTTSGTRLVCMVCANTCFLPGTTSIAAIPSSSSSFSLQAPSFSCACASCSPSGCLFAARAGAEVGVLGSVIDAEITHQLKLAASRQAAEAGIAMVMSQPSSSSASSASTETTATTAGKQQMMGRMNGGANHMRSYESLATLAKAKRTIPIAKLHRLATEALQANIQARKLSTSTTSSQSSASSSSVTSTTTVSPPPAKPAPLSYPRALLDELVKWFKFTFFLWVNNIPCSSCQSSNTVSEGGAAPTPQERNEGGAGMVEIYRCKACNAVSRFPRYNNPAVLLDTHRGRCGEWANCFTLCALALGFDARHVHDWTDHVWTEVWIPFPSHANPLPDDDETESSSSSLYHSLMGRWHHVDSCEAAVDAALLYEAGWGKSLSYIVAFGLDEVVDVTRRYTKKFDEVLGRRQTVSEPWLANAVSALNVKQRESASRGSGASAARRVYLQKRSESEVRFLESNIAHDDGVRKEDELNGRISGSLAWRVARQEVGAGGTAAVTNGTQGAGDTVTSSSTDTTSPALKGPLKYLSSSPPGVVTGGFQLVQTAPIPPSASSASSPTSASVASATNATNNTDSTHPSITQLTSFGGQLLALFSDNSFGWRIAPTIAATVDHLPNIIPSSAGWKPVPIAAVTEEETIVRISNSNDTAAAAAGEKVSTSSWPHTDDSILAVAAEPRSLRFFALVSKSIAKMNVSSATSTATTTADDAKGTSTIYLWVVQAPPPGAGKTWRASVLGECSLDTLPASSEAAPTDEEDEDVGDDGSGRTKKSNLSMVITNGRLYLAHRGAMWESTLSTSELNALRKSSSDNASSSTNSSDDKSSATAKVEGLPKVTWNVSSTGKIVDTPPALRKLASTFSGIIVGNEQDQISILLHSTRISSSSLSSLPNEAVMNNREAVMNNRVPFHQQHQPGTLDISLSYPETVYVGKGGDESSRTTMNPPFDETDTVFAPLHVTIHVSAAAASSVSMQDWVALVRVGHTTESSIVGLALPTDWPAVSHLQTSSSSSSSSAEKTYTASFASDVLRSMSPGLYELRYYSGVGLKTLRGVAQIPILAVQWKGEEEEENAAAEARRRLASTASFRRQRSQQRWVPLFPSLNVVGLALATGVATLGGDASTVCVYAATRSGELWGVTLPRAVVAVGASSSSSSFFTPFLPSAAAAAGTSSSSSDLALELPLPQHKPRKYGTGNVNLAAAVLSSGEGSGSGNNNSSSGEDTSPSTTSPSLPPPSSSTTSSISTPPAIVSPADLKVKVGILFKQLTTGCGVGTCTNSRYCVSGGSVPLAPNVAAATALKLIVGGNTEVFCL